MTTDHDAQQTPIAALPPDLTPTADPKGGPLLIPAMQEMPRRMTTGG